MIKTINNASKQVFINYLTFVTLCTHIPTYIIFQNYTPRLAYDTMVSYYIGFVKHRLAAAMTASYPKYRLNWIY